MRVEITDHALVRWIERTGLVDVGPLRQALAASLHRAAEAADLAAGKYLILADGLVYVMDGGVLITVLNDDGRNSRIAPMRDRPGDRRQGEPA